MSSLETLLSIAMEHTYLLVCNSVKPAPAGSVRPAPLAATRHAKRVQPTHNISDSYIPHLRILSILCQHFVAFDHRDQKPGGLFRNQVAAADTFELSPPSSQENTRL